VYLPELHEELVRAAARPSAGRRRAAGLAGALSAALLSLLVAAPATHALLLAVPHA
jgi:hypothetical protein